MALVRLTLSALALVDDLISRYQQMKKAHGLLDFDDLIVRTMRLLGAAGCWALGPVQAR